MSGSTAALALTLLGCAQRARYAAAFVWSILGDDDQSAYPSDLVAWTRTHAGPESA